MNDRLMQIAASTQWEDVIDVICDRCGDLTSYPRRVGNDILCNVCARIVANQSR